MGSRMVKAVGRERWCLQSRVILLQWSVEVVQARRKKRSSISCISLQAEINAMEWVGADAASRYLEKGLGVARDQRFVEVTALM